MNPVAAPERTLDQRMAALRMANEVRFARAKLKRDLKSGRVSVVEILADPPAYLATARTFDVLQALPKFGQVKAARTMNRCRMSQSKTVGGMSDRQRGELVAMIQGNRLG